MSNRRMLLVAASLLTGATVLPACNSLTGVDDLTIRDRGAGGAAGAGGEAASGPSGTTGSGPSAVTTGLSATVGTGMAPMLVAAQGVSISQIALYQAVKRVLMQDGSDAASTVPVVANRPALIRVFVAADGSYDGSAVTARLDLGDGAPMELETVINGSSSDANLGSTINFQVPASAMVPGMKYRVELLQLSSHSTGSNLGASYPAKVSASIPVQSTGASLRVQLVPVTYGADASNRAPDTSPGQIQAYQDEFFKIYPVASVEITTHAAVAWNSKVDPNGSGWSDLLDSIANLRQQDDAPEDVYYFGIFAPATSETKYCSAGCVAGLGLVGAPTDTYSRAAIGLGFPGGYAAETAVHEVGHNHGRQHSPCGGAQGTDPAYPYANASIGVWGYDLLEQTLFSPDDTTDVMGYCQPIWISDYTYKALFDRIKIVNNASVIYPAELMDRTYQRARVDGDGNLTWLPDTLIHAPPMGEPTPITLQTAAGDAVIEAQLYPYDHLPGGVLVWPQPASLTKAIVVQHAGKVKTLGRATFAW